MNHLKDFRGSFAFTAVCLGLAFLFGGLQGAFLSLILGVMEVSLSFDNAIVNAKVLANMSAVWQRRFITWGILIAVFGMRVVFPVVIVALTGAMNPLDVVQLAISNPVEYGHHLHAAHTQIMAFGGMFLLNVFLSFLFEEREIHWLPFEEKLAAIGKLDMAQVLVSIITLVGVTAVLPAGEQLKFVIAGLLGLATYVALESITGLFGGEEAAEGLAESAKKAGLMSFIYLEVLDASFSFDGVIGAFAMTSNIVIIALGLGIGAMFVRSLTIKLVKEGTLSQFVHLEHGAHWSIGVLAAIMFVSITQEVPEVVTGVLSVAFILASVATSLSYNKQLAQAGV